MHIQLLLATNDQSCRNFFQQGLRFYKHSFHLDLAVSIEELLTKSFTYPYDLIILDGKLRATSQFHTLINKQSDLRAPLLITVEQEREILIWKQYLTDTEKIIVRTPQNMKNLPFLLQSIFQKEQIFSRHMGTWQKSTTTLQKAEPAKIQAGYCLIDQKNKFVSVHPTVYKNLGYSESELLELTLDDLIHPDKLVSYHHWLAEEMAEKSHKPFAAELFSKNGTSVPVKLQLQPYKNARKEILHYQLKIQFLPTATQEAFSSNGHINQLKMITEISDIIRAGRNKSLHAYLESIARMASTTFKFHRITLALLDRRKNAFLKQIMLGYSGTNGNQTKVLEIPHSVINKIFDLKYNVRVIYRNKKLDKFHLEPFSLEERRLQPRDDGDTWDPNNVIILNLTDQRQNSFGYISMDRPLGRFVPKRDIFHNLELFSKLASLAIENYYHYATLEKRTRRLKRLLVTGNIFKLSLTGTEVMREMVWSIRFSLDFQLIMLGLINPKTKNVTIKAVSCHDHVKTLQLQNLSLPADQLKTLFDTYEVVGTTILTNKPETVFQPIKNIYYDEKIESNQVNSWKWWNMLIVPVPGNNNHPLGYIFADDPADGLLPSRETIQTLEIFAQQLSIALKNRYLYLQEKKKFELLRQHWTNSHKSDSSKTSSWLKDILSRER